MKKIIIFSIIIGFFSFSCKKQNSTKPKDWHKINKQLIKVNKYLVKEDRDRIISYIKRKGWNMKESPTGFWYQIYYHGNGDSARNDEIATINYTIELLDGTLCYSSDSTGPKIFKIGLSNVVPGLQQAILLLRQGDKARFIFPPHLAYGLVGDEKKIPPRSIIVYNLQLIKLQKHK